MTARDYDPRASAWDEPREDAMPTTREKELKRKQYFDSVAAKVEQRKAEAKKEAKK